MEPRNARPVVGLVLRDRLQAHGTDRPASTLAARHSADRELQPPGRQAGRHEHLYCVRTTPSPLVKTTTRIGLATSKPREASSGSSRRLSPVVSRSLMWSGETPRASTIARVSVSVAVGFAQVQRFTMTATTTRPRPTSTITPHDRSHQGIAGHCSRAPHQRPFVELPRDPRQPSSHDRPPSRRPPRRARLTGKRAKPDEGQEQDNHALDVAPTTRPSTDVRQLQQAVTL